MDSDRDDNLLIVNTIHTGSDRWPRVVFLEGESVAAATTNIVDTRGPMASSGVFAFRVSQTEKIEVEDTPKTIRATPQMAEIVRGYASIGFLTEHESVKVAKQAKVETFENASASDDD